jgi:hypothetical protein
MRALQEAPAGVGTGGTLEDQLGGVINTHRTANRAQRHELGRRRWSRVSRAERDRLAAVGQAAVDAFEGDAVALLGSLVERLDRATP